MGGLQVGVVVEHGHLVVPEGPPQVFRIVGQGGDGQEGREVDAKGQAMKNRQHQAHSLPHFSDQGNGFLPRRRASQHVKSSLPKNSAASPRAP